MDLFVQTLINGVLVGGILIAIAAGFSISFGVMDIIDFAVGEWIMLGAFIGYWLHYYTKVDPLWLLPVVFFIFFIVGYLFQPVLYKIVSSRHSRAALMGLAFTFGMSTFFRGLALTLWGFNNRSMTTVLSDQGLSILGLTVPALRAASSLFAIFVTVVFVLLLNKTRIGIAVRAVAQNKPAAGLMGVNAQKVGALVYGVYSGLTGISGVLVGSIFSINPEMGG